jgi:uncharacterized protein (TIGR03435 family)
VRNILVSRFKLRIRHEAKELSAYELVLEKERPKFLEDKSHLEESGVRPYSPGGGETGLDVESCELAAFAHFLSLLPEFQGRRILDGSGLHGYYSFKLHWMREVPSLVPQDTESKGPTVPSGPSFFTALHAQLGLKLESIKAPVDIIVIDHIERPSEN